MALQDDLTDRIVETGATRRADRHLRAGDRRSFIGRMLANIAAMSRVLDAETVVVGMRPAVAITLVELGLSLPGVRTALNVERGMAMIVPGRGEQARHDGSRTIVGADRAPLPIAIRRGRGAGAPAGAHVGDRSRASAWWTRPRSSPRPANWRATRLIHGGRRQATLEIVQNGRAPRRADHLRGPGTGHPRYRAGPEGRLHHRQGMGLGLGGARRLVQRIRDHVDAGPGHARDVITRWK